MGFFHWGCARTLAYGSKHTGTPALKERGEKRPFVAPLINAFVF